ncbi:MAG: hypothetical protein J7L15_07560 [Clostridiales bacterium]|nr:hypothetical protein [Clostridiales bacterium]
MKKILMACPKCKCVDIWRTLVITELVQIVDDGEGLTDEVYESMTDEVSYKCSNCGAELTEEELIRIEGEDN